MSLPSDLNTREVVGTYVDYSGAPVEGTISFTSSTRLVVDAQDTAVLPSTIVGRLVNGVLLAEDGQSPLLLPVTDDQDAAPQNFTYAVKENFEGPYPGTTFNLQVPSSAEPLDLPAQSPSTPPSNPSTQAVTQVNGKNPNAAGQVTLSAADVGAAPTVHTHSITQVTGLAVELDGKADAASLATVATTGSYDDLTDAPPAVTLTDTPRYVLYDSGWPARGTSPRLTFFIGGDAAADTPTDPNLQPGDVWIPGS